MSDFLLIQFLGAVAFILLGVRFAGRGFEGAFGERIRAELKRLSGRPFPSYVAGFFTTVVLQSSGATVALLLSLSVMNPISLPASLAVVLGADLGATIIVQLISFRIASISFLVIAVGAPFYLFGKTSKMRGVGQGVLGFGFILFAIYIVTSLSGSVREIPGLVEILRGLDRAPLICFVGGLIFAVVFQSSTAVLALMIGFSVKGLVSVHATFPAVLGANVGSTVIAFLSAIGSGQRGMRIAWGHLFFKVAGALLFFPFLPYFPDLLARVSFDQAHMVANMHTLFNLTISLLFLPFINPVAAVLEKRIPEAEEEDEFRLKFLDASFSSSPSVGVAQLMREILRMADVVRSMLVDVGEVIRTNNADLLDEVARRDDLVDFLDREIKRFLATHERVDSESDVGKMSVVFISVLSNLEHMADIVDKGLCEQLRNKILNGLEFSREGEKEILMYHRRVVEMFDEAILAFMRMDRDTAQRVIGRKKDLSLLEKELKNAHIRRLNQGMKESLETSSIHLDILSSLRRIVTVSAGIAYLVVDFTEKE
ncbi:MAG: Na/Pi cotransporter family protein [Deltaproteobacteria bacterium]|nr:MAG: Na/Pi cotransporter family protein [Deltaproteobacteria bacterium]